jgi:hypothetical protein
MNHPHRAAGIRVRLVVFAFAAVHGTVPAASAQVPAVPATPAAPATAAAPATPATAPSPGVAAPSPVGARPVVIPPPPPLPCTAAEAKQFDFWLGDWKVAWDATPGMPAGTGANRVSRVLDGCAIEENFRTDEAEPLVGRSLSVWSPSRQRWQQTWVDNQGSYLDFTGGFSDGRMVLAREGADNDGKRRLQRMTFENIRTDALDWRWESSADGREWKTNWLIRYTRIR